jgi:hypothetical protein
MPEERMVKKKVYKWKKMLRRPLESPKNRWEDDIRNDMNKLKIKNGLTASKIVITGNYMLRRPKHSKTEVVAPKEDEELLSLRLYYVRLYTTSVQTDPLSNIKGPQMVILPNADRNLQFVSETRNKTVP